MTLYLFDIASYQRGINLVKVKAAGFTLANVKTSQGVGYTFADAGAYARQAHAIGMGVSLFHWLDGLSSGAAQADAWWRVAKPIIAGIGRVAMQVDNEDTSHPATWAITRDFVHAVADRLGHLPFMYTGDWWATSGGRASWDVHSLTPWLMAAPNRGYPGTYPGDQAPQWRAGYWGYDNLSLMQYAVSPIAGAGGGDISKTAIRDDALWAALTGGSTLVTDDYGTYNRPKDIADRTVAVMTADLWGGEALGHSPYVPAQQSYRAALLDRVDAGIAALRAKADADEVRDGAMQAALNAMAGAIKAGGGDVEAGAILAKIDEVHGLAQERFEELHADLAAAARREARLTGLLHALGADLTALDTGDDGQAPTT